MTALNVGAFCLTMFRRVRTLGPGDDVPLAARIMGGTSLLQWVGVMTGGRLITFCRP